MLCFVVVMQSFIMNSHEIFIHIHQGCFAGTGAIVRLPQCQWSKPDGYGKISQCITTTKHSKAVTVCIFLGIYCTNAVSFQDLVSYLDWRYLVTERQLKIHSRQSILVEKWPMGRSALPANGQAPLDARTSGDRGMIRFGSSIYVERQRFIFHQLK